MPVSLNKGFVAGLRGFIITDHRFSPVNDTSVLDPGIKPAPRAGAIFHDYLVFGWFPGFYLVVTIAFLPLFVGGIFVVFEGLDEDRFRLILLGLGMMVAGPVLVFSALMFYRRRKFLVLDRRRGLVHIPRYFTRKMDRIRFADANFLIMDRPSPYGVSTSTHMYLVRPGRDLVDDNGSWRLHWIEFDTPPSRESAQRLWAFIVGFMAGEEHGPRDADKEVRKIHLAEARFDASVLEDELTWWRDEAGRWHRVDQAAGKLPPQLVFPPVYTGPAPRPALDEEEAAWARERAKWEARQARRAEEEAVRAERIAAARERARARKAAQGKVKKRKPRIVR